MKKNCEMKNGCLSWVGLGFITVLSCFYSKNIFTLLEFMGIYIFILNSVKYANEDKRYKNKLHVLVIIAIICTFGGGISRDICILFKWPTLLSNITWVIITIISIFFSIKDIDNRCVMSLTDEWFNLIEDTTIIAFIQGGYAVAYEHGLNCYVSLFSGVLTGCGGGIITTVIFYKNQIQKQLGTIKNIGYTCLGAVLLTFFGFGQSLLVVLIWLCISIVREPGIIINAIKLRIISNNGFVSCFTCNIWTELVKSLQLTYYKVGYNNYLKTKYTVQIYQLIISRFTRVRTILKNCVNKVKYRSRKHYFYYRSAVRTF